MQILVVNSGSSTLKFELVDVAPDVLRADPHGLSGTRSLARGLVDRVGGAAHVDFQASPGRDATSASQSSDAAIPDHRAAAARALAWLDEQGARIDAVGHRVVHGGERFVAPTRLGDEVVAALEELNELAPLHNPAALQGIRAARDVLGAAVPMVAVFDTAFHAGLPLPAATYAIPHELAARHRIRRYGFHGLAHEFMLRRAASMLGTPTETTTLVTLQLGNGCSATAIRDGRSVDTSMGFTPLEGLVMGTRSGDVDPSLVSYLGRHENVDAAEVERWLDRRSGLLGVSGRSSDMRDLLAASATDPRAALAIDVFCHRARKYVGAYLAVLGGAQAIVFGGGIGEHAADIRARIAAGFEWCGLHVDPQRNAALTGDGRITTDDSRLHAFVVQVNEATLIARATAALLSDRR